jgi:hypothetical protein
VTVNVAFCWMWRRMIWRLICYAPASRRNMLGILQVQEGNVPEIVGSSLLRNVGSCVRNCATVCTSGWQSSYLKQTKMPCNQTTTWRVIPVQTWIKITQWKFLSLLLRLCTFLGTFVKLRKATIGFVMSVRPSVCLSTKRNSAPTGRIFHDIWYWVFLEKTVEKTQVH